jgi:two-component system copper resistance phosphate regulon response regulator CusR
MPRLLVIEDEARVRAGLEEGLRAAGFEVRSAATGDEGSRLAAAQPFDGIVLDWMLPGRDGLQVLADLRRSGRRTPVLLLTARDAVADRVLGLDSGADDYLIKPFAFAELLARLRVLLRRGQADRETVLRAGDALELDLLRRRVTRDGVEVGLTPREFAVLEYLVRHKNEPVTREMLGLDVFQEPGYAYTNVIEVYINLLRKKVEVAGRSPRIVTLRGVGYSLRE